VEKQVLDAKNVRDSMDKKNKELQKEIELLNGKIKGAAGEKTRICGILDAKVSSRKLPLIPTTKSTLFPVP
jgi:hypothetical protein